MEAALDGSAREPEEVGDLFVAEVLLVPQQHDLSVLLGHPRRAQGWVGPRANHAHDTAADPLSGNLFWYDGAHWQALRVDSLGDDLTVHPPRQFLATMSRLAAMDFVRAAAEA